MPQISTVKVLVIDDDKDDAMLVSELLEEAQRAFFIVETAETAEAGYDRIRSQRYDVVLLDYKLRDTDGLTFLQKLREENIPLPVIIVTNYGDKSLQVRAVEAGAAEYLEKGKFDTNVLERTCIYAIGLQKKADSDGKEPTMGYLMEQLVELTRNSVAAQHETRTAVSKISLENLASKAQVNELKSHMDAKQDAVLHEVRLLSKARWFLEWVAKNRVVALILFFCLVIIAVLTVILINFLDIEHLEAIRGATGSLHQTGLTKWPLS